MTDDWPKLDPDRDGDTFALLHLASQLLGKLRVAHATWVNHGWHVTLHPIASGLITASTAAADGRSFTLAIDLCDHGIALKVSDGAEEQLAFEDGGTVAGLHAGLIAMLDRQGLPSTFHGTPNEIEGAVPFAEDTAPRPYRRASAEALRDALARIVPLFEHFRAGFQGKASPVHFFWGGFDLAVTRFSGRSAPPHPGGVPGMPDRITREAYSHEVSSAGFWPAGTVRAEPIFYSYAYPAPDGFAAANVRHGRFDEALGEFVLPYAEVRAAADSAAMLGDFLRSTYEAAADLGHWDRTQLERKPVAP